MGWKGVDFLHDSGRITSPAPLPDASEIVHFTQCNYHCHEDAGMVQIGVHRIGPCTETVKVKVETVDKDATSTGAVGKNFKHFDAEIEFKPGESVKTFEVKVLA